LSVNVWPPADTHGCVPPHAGEVDHPARAGRQVADPLGAEGLEPEQRDQLLDPVGDVALDLRCGRQPEGTGDHVVALDPALERHGDRLAHGQAGEQLRVLERPPDARPGPGRRCQRRDVVAVVHDPPGVGRGEARHEVEHRGLAGAVRADESDDLAGAGRDVDVVDRRDAAEGHRQAGQVERGRLVATVGQGGRGGVVVR
jgi:hypothetical protein